MYPPGLRLRQTRESLGLTYRDVEKASYQIAVNRGRSDFILHISRLADIENRGVVPSLHKLYSLAAILHLDPLEISNWYEAPLHETHQDGAAFPPPRTYLSQSRLPRSFLIIPKAFQDRKVPNCCKRNQRPGCRCRRCREPEKDIIYTVMLDFPTAGWCHYCGLVAPS